jgi:5-methylcytosine-specific restriction protein A
MAWSKETRQSRGYGKEWQRIRLIALRRDHNLCQVCLKNGFVTRATQVDHIINKAKGGTDNIENLQSICKECHDKKTIQEKGYTVKKAIGIDGFPIE